MKMDRFCLLRTPVGSKKFHKTRPFRGIPRGLVPFQKGVWGLFGPPVGGFGTRVVRPISLDRVGQNSRFRPSPGTQN